MGTGPKWADENGKSQLAAAYEQMTPQLKRIGARRALDGEEIGQDAIVRVLGALERGAIADPIRYVFRVARNLFIDAERGRARNRARIDPDADLGGQADGAADPERIFAGKQRLGRALAVIEDLPPRCRQAFRLHRFDGLGYVAIAREMGITPSMVEKHIALAMLRLSRALDDDEG